MIKSGAISPKANGTRTVSIANYETLEEPIAIDPLEQAVAYVRGRAFLPIVVLIMSTSMLLAWALNFEVWHQPIVGIINAKFNTCLCFFLLAASILATNWGNKKLALFLTMPIIACTALTACEYSFQIDLGIDQFWIVDDRSVNLLPGRMAPSTIVCLLFSAAAVLLKDFRLDKVYPTEIIGYLMALFSLIALTAYANKLPSFYQQVSTPTFSHTFTVMAFSVAVMFFITSLSIMALSEEYWFYKLWSDKSHGGEMVRSFLALSLVVPLGSGFLKTYLQGLGLTTEDAAVTIIVCGMIGAFSILISKLAVKFQKIDAEKMEIGQQREDLLFALAHDMKVPLIGSERVLEQILSGRVSDEAMKLEYLGLIKQSNENLLWTIQNLLYRYKQETGIANLNISNQAIEPLILAGLQQMQPLAREKNVIITYDGSARDIYLDIDDEAVRRIILNLIHNATKFTQNGTIAVTALEDGERFLLKIADSGCGMNEQQLSALFQKGHQAEEGRRYTTGSGLGLHFSRHLMRAHRGDLVASSSQEPGQSGTVFTLIFSR